MSLFPEPLTAAASFNACWDLLRQPQRSAEQDRRMLTLAHASRALWAGPGGPREAAIGDWQISRCYAVLGQGSLAVSFAGSALDLAVQTPLDRFMIASCHEAMARALLVAGDAGAEAHLTRARALADLLDDPEDRQILLEDLADHPAP
jgi:hypothetical protein